MSKLRSDELVNMEGDGAPSFPQGATSIEPTANNQVATKLYVDSALSAASGNAVSDTAPTNPAVGSFWTDTSVSPSLLKTWNGSMWIEFAGTASAAVGVVVSLPSLSATNAEHAPATITAAAAQVSGATLFITKWYKDDVEIVGETGSTYVATEPGVYRYEERWADAAGNVLTPSLNKTIELLTIQAPSIISPVVDTGVPDFDFTAESSAITNVGSVNVLDGSAFSTTYWSGNDSNDRIIQSGIDNTEDSLIWIKNRTSGGYEHILSGQHLVDEGKTNVVTNATRVAGTETNYTKDFLNNGFVIGNSSHVNGSGNDYVGWNFLKTSGFFDIVTYDGDSNSGREISHNLGSIPGMIIVKCIQDDGTDGATTNWTVHHKSLPNTEILKLNTTDSSVTSNHFHDTTPTDQVFTVGSGLWVNSSLGNRSYVAYLFADNPSNGIKCGTYTGTNYTGPVQVDCGFRAKWVMIKSTVNSDKWRIYWDGSSTPGSTSLAPNTHNAEDGGGGVPHISFTNSGFTVENSAGYSQNWADTFVFMAIGTPQATVSQPQLTLTDTTVSKISDGTAVGGSTIDQVLTVGETVQADTSITSTVNALVFDAVQYTGNSTGTGSGLEQVITTGIDNTQKSMIWFKNRNSSSHAIFDTERTPPDHRWLRSDSSGVELDSAEVLKDRTDTGFTVVHPTSGSGVATTNPSGNEPDMVAWNFRAAPGFFDIVTYTGISEGAANQSQAISHNLGSEPGMIMIKAIDDGSSWMVYHKELEDNTWIRLNENWVKSGPLSGVIPPTQSSTEFNIGASTSINKLGKNYVAYLFADTPGKIKCGTYTGDAYSTQTIDCGFEPGFVLIKATDHASDWVATDYKLMASGQYFHPNNDQELKNNAIVGSASNGFTAASGSGDVSANGKHYIYVAIAKDLMMDIDVQSTASGTVASSSGNTITLSNSSGTWSTGMKIQGVTTDIKDNPDRIDASAVTFTSSEPATTSGTVSTWDYAEWNLSHDSAFSGVVHQKAVPLTATGTQAGPDDFTIQAGTEYFVRTKYASSLPVGQSNWSAVTRFLTKANVYADDLFSTYLYEGNGSVRTIANGIDLSGEGGLTWIKCRTISDLHYLYDTERGATKSIYTDQDYAEGTRSQTLTSFNSDGFSLGTDGDTNLTGRNYVSWTFRKAPGFFDVVTYTGSGSARTVSHNLGSVPGMIIIKRTNSAENWATYHRSQGATKTCRLNGDFPFSTSSSTFNDTEPTSTEFTVGTNSEVNSNGDTFVAYLFAHDDQSFGTDSDESIIKCGSYTGNGGYQTVDLGFEAQWVMIKCSSRSGDDWGIFDVMRGAPGGDATTIGNGSKRLRPNGSDEEGYSGVGVDSNGFVLGNGSSEVNTSGQTYIYMAIRRPHKPPTSATEVFALDAASSSNSGTGNAFDAPFAVDMEWHQQWGANAAKYFSTRLTSGKYSVLNMEIDEASSSTITYDSSDGVLTAFGHPGYSAQMFKRAPGFMDLVAYKPSTGATSSTISHNLGVVPELIITKRRDNGNAPWAVYSSVTGNGNYLKLDTNDDASFAANLWQSTTPTSTEFYVNNNNAVGNDANNYIAFLFASLDGISKVGSYSGTGSNVNVDCGFTAGARFVLIKRTDSTGDWYLWDTAHGIVSGDEPYLLLNEDQSEVTNTDYIDPLNAGFTVTSSAPAALNETGGTYLFLAIA